MSTIVERQIPARSLVQGLRAVGYNFSTAVADIIDNSISAKATRIDVISNPIPKNHQPYFCILDNGCGMNCFELDNAMLLGSDRSAKKDSDIELGRFGLGLKSASLSQCRKFIVASKQNDVLCAMEFNLDIIERDNKLNLLVLDSDEIADLPEISMLEKYDSGTLVIWNDFDRVEKSAKSFEDSFRQVVFESKKHIEFVFHRFYPKIEIYFNHVRIEKRDPFLLDAQGRQQTGRQSIIKQDGSEIVVTPHTLPYMDNMTKDELKLLGNPKSIYDEQGFYLYRNKRLIAWGSWMRMGVRSELNKLARVQIDIPSTLDSIWSLDVKKSSAKIPDKLKERIQIALDDSITRSRRATRYPGQKERSIENKVWDSVEQRDDTVRYQINRDNPLYKTLCNSIGKNERKILDTFISQIESFIPQKRILLDHAESKVIENSGDHMDESDLIEQIKDVVAMCDPSVKTIVLESMLMAEAYQKLSGKKEQVRKMVLNEK